MQKGAVIGLDYNSWLVGPEFMGFKMINPGFHCLFYSSVNSQHEFSVRTILPIFLESKEVHVYSWDAKEEQLVDQKDLPEEEVTRYQRSGSQFVYDKQTAYYPFETIGKWMNMTNHISIKVYKRLMSVSPSSFVLDPTVTPQYNYTPTVNITQLVKRGDAHSQLASSSSSGPVSRLSQLYLDASDELERLCRQSSYSEVVGEFQFAFVLFHIGQSYESFLQWKNILFLLTASFSMATSGDISVVAFYRSAMKTLRLQLSELDDDFFLLSQGEEGEMREAVQGDGGKQRVNRTNFVIKCLESFNQILLEEPAHVDGEVKETFQAIRATMRRRFGVEFEDTCEGPFVME
ncbi:hypothetical protein WA588_004281, partial [Blastocystis sp. NMH]